MIAVIPAAGKGTRLKKITKGKPKELLEISGKPVINWCVEELINCEIIIVINEKKKLIKFHLGEDNFTYVYQPKPYGVADAIYRCKNLINDEQFIVSLPDNIFIGEKNPISELIPVAKKYKKNTIALSKVSKKMAKYFGNCGGVSLSLLEPNVYKITEIKPKEKGYFSTDGKEFVFRYFPRYVFNYEIFNYIDKIKYVGELDDVPLLQELAKNNLLIGVEIIGKFFDVGNIRGYKFCKERLKC